MNPTRSVFNRIHKEGQPFILIAFVLAVLVLFFLSETLGWILIILAFYVIYFFRDPVRVTPDLDDVLVSAADGVVTKVDEAAPPKELEMGEALRPRISVFLSIFNVHVNRMPASGKITGLVYVPGKFLNATLDKSSEENERQLIKIARGKGGEVACVQIAGLIARRIVCDLQMEQSAQMGSRFGIIRFGSRVDVYCPEGMHPTVLEGQTVVGGETIIAAERALAKRLEGRKA